MGQLELKFQGGGNLVMLSENLVENFESMPGVLKVIFLATFSSPLLFAFSLYSEDSVFVNEFSNYYEYMAIVFLFGCSFSLSAWAFFLVKKERKYINIFIILYGVTMFSPFFFGLYKGFAYSNGNVASLVLTGFFIQAYLSLSPGVSNYFKEK